MKKLSFKTSLGFAVGDVGGNLYFSIIGFVFIFYLTEELGLSGTLAGTSMMIGKVWDAITDPIISSISDRSKSKFGRRRPFMFWGGLLLFISMVLMFSVPDFDSSTTTFIIATLLFCLLGTSSTLVNIPYCALQPELTDDYNEKTTLSSLRMSFAIIGTVLAVTARPLAESIGSDNSGWTIMALIMGFIMLLTTWITVFSVKEGDNSKLKQQKGILLSYKEAFKNREFVYALIPWVLFGISVTLVQTSFLYYFKYVFNDAGKFEITLFGLIFMSLICFPLWVTISKRLSKGPSYMLGMGIFAFALICSYFISPILGVLSAVIIITFSGIGFSTHYIMPFTIITDVVELDTARTGIRREGVYLGIWTFVTKLGQAIAGLIIGITLDLVGFVSPTSTNQIVNQSDRTIDGISFLCGPLPVIFILIGIVVLGRYPITKEYYNKNITGEDE